jgi:hypothetical protein
MTPKTPPGGWWRGSGPPGDPGAQRFTAAMATDECEGCLFRNTNSATCRQAGSLALAQGLPDCEERGPGGQTYIYLLDKGDPRQIDLIKILKSTESEI